MMEMNRQLFIDDYGIESMRGLTRTMHRVTKHPNNPTQDRSLLLRPERPWEGEGFYISNSAIYDQEERLFKIWYQAGEYTCYATSKDGLHWNRPNLSLVEFEGSTDNNIVEGRAMQVVYDQAAPKNQRYKTLTWNPERGYHTLFSEDGLVWVFQQDTPLTGVGDVFVAVRSSNALTSVTPLDAPADGNETDSRSSDAENGFPPKYIGCVRLCCPVGRFDGSSNIRPTRRVLALTTSENWTDWTEPFRILTPDARDDEMAHTRIEAALADGTLAHDQLEDRRCEFYTMYIIPYEGLFLGMMFVFDPSYEFHRIGKNNQAGPREVQLVVSRDLKNWQRLGGRQPFIPRGRTGEFDCAEIGYICLPIIVGDELWFYYSGQTVTHAGSRDEKYMTELRAKINSGEWAPLSSIGLAELRRDGFVSLDAGDKEGNVLTKPFVMPEGELHLNVDASKGEVWVEVTDEEGLSHEDLNRSELVRGDQHNAIVRFGGTNIKSLSGRMIRLRIHARNTKLYSFWFE